MSLFKELISQIDPNASVPSTPSPVERSATGSPKPTPKLAPRTTTPTNGTSSDSQTLKRKASGTIESAQVKTLRKDAPAPPRQPNGGTVRNPPAPAPIKSNTPTSTTSMPYRGTAGLGTPKPAPAQVKKPGSQATTSSTAPKPAAPASKPGATGTTSAAPTKKTGGYMAMLMKAKEKDQTKAVAPPIKHEPTKILTKKERLEAKAAAKGKKPAAGPTAKATTGKLEPGKETRKPASIGYQGTARPSAPIRKPVEIGYKGTARPSSTLGPVGRSGAAAARRRPNNNEYGRWSEDDMEDDEEEEEDEDGFYSDSDDMEGGIWDVEKEEEEALKLARKEDAEALAEENRLKREKEERKRKLMALSKNAAGRKRSQY